MEAKKGALVNSHIKVGGGGGGLQNLRAKMVWNISLYLHLYLYIKVA